MSSLSGATHGRKVPTITWPRRLACDLGVSTAATMAHGSVGFRVQDIVGFVAVSLLLKPEMWGPLLDESPIGPASELWFDPVGVAEAILLGTARLSITSALLVIGPTLALVEPVAALLLAVAPPDAADATPK